MYWRSGVVAVVEQIRPIKEIMQLFDIGQASKAVGAFAEKPVLLPLFLPADSVDERSYVQLTCVASSGDLPMDFTWLLNGRKISVGQVAGVTSVAVSHQTSLLIIASVALDQAGNYTCRVANSAGQSSTSVQVKVNGKLNARQILNSNSLASCFFKNVERFKEKKGRDAERSHTPILIPVHFQSLANPLVPFHSSSLTQQRVPSHLRHSIFHQTVLYLERVSLCSTAFHRN